MLEKNKKIFIDLCKEYLKEKEKAEYFNNVYKKDFYKKISKAFRQDEDKIILGDNKTNFVITKIENRKIIYDLEKIKKNLPKESYKKIVDKKVLVLDDDGLLQLLKDYNIPYSKIKGILSIESVVDEEALEQELQLGNIDKKVIAKYSKVENTKESYFKVSKDGDKK